MGKGKQRLRLRKEGMMQGGNDRAIMDGAWREKQVSKSGSQGVNQGELYK